MCTATSTYTSACVFLLVVLFCDCINCVNTQNDTEPAQNASNACGNIQQMVDECFKEMPPHLVAFLQTTKIAINEQEIASKCNVFNRGIKCFDEYTSRCLSEKKKLIFKNNVQGARRFFLKFCEDPEFQEAYLLHKDCLSYIQHDWLRCTKDFQKILTEELHVQRRNVTNKFMEFCCTRNAYEQCIFNSARYKCYPHSALFARDMARMLSNEKHFTDCRQYEETLCHTDGAPRSRARLLCLQLPLLLLLCSYEWLIRFVWRSKVH